MPSFRVLASWIGFTDLQASRGDVKAGIGPIGQALEQRQVDEVLLLSNYPRPRTNEYVEWAERRTKAKVGSKTWRA